MRKLAIIGGTGVEDPQKFPDFESRTLLTPYGEAAYKIGERNGAQVVFLSRHGTAHSVAPHKVNYRANIWALKKLGTEEVLATTAVGSLNPAITAGQLVICSDVLDFTKNRINTFYDSPERGVVHVDFTSPYCPRLRAHLHKLLTKLGIEHSESGVYVCTEGPRFESPAEIKMFAKSGGDVVGMTNMPEAVLAREAELCYANCSIVTNMAAGISPTPLSHSEVVAAMTESIEKTGRLIDAFIEEAPAAEGCACASALAEFGGFKL